VSREEIVVNEAEWLACPNPWTMLSHVQQATSPRKLWLFAIACCRRVWHLLHAAGDRALVEATERFAEGLLTQTDWLEAVVLAAPTRTPRGEAGRSPVDRAAFAAAHLLVLQPYRAADCVSFHAVAAMQLAEGPKAPDWFLDYGRVCLPFGAKIPEWHPERVAQASLIRCIFGNPFRPGAVDPSWLTWNGGTVVKLANSIYSDRAFDRLPILADALEEAGCHDAGILAHCRGPGPHVLGCFVLDALPGKN
jgi:hypothetical protein